ncbi:MAG TPA: ribonuclease H-like YkuK family protein [Flavobacteriales bacterium]|nr:ribonuclease H-like YkuK family protein [Flavobacteriales bacterium]
MSDGPHLGFKSMHDGRAVDLLAHVGGVLAAHRDVEVMVGSDSHNYANHTVYTTTVVMRFFRNGAQVVYRREKAPKVVDLWTRLWGEVERSLVVAQILRTQGSIDVCRIDMDLNSDARFGSHKLHTAAVGYVRSHGYEPHTKPDMLIATWAANLLCNGMGRKHEAPIRRMADRGDVTLQIDL